MFDDVDRSQLVESAVRQRVREPVEIANNVGCARRIDVDADRAWILANTAADIQNSQQSSSVTVVLHWLHLNTTPPRRRLFLYGLIAGLAIFTSLLLTRNIDFRGYWYAVRALTDGSRPLYGPSSGIGFPMYYRYPPVTYILL